MTRPLSRLHAGLALLGIATLALASPKKPLDLSPEARVARILATTPLVDGHNDLPYELRLRDGGDPIAAHLEVDQSTLPANKDRAPLMTDMPRLHAGHVGGQFWSVWIPATVTGPDAVQMTLDQIDIEKRLVAAYPRDLESALTAADVRRIHHSGKVASLIGVEGGHQINGSLATLRQYYALGVRYMTLTHTATTPWADAATDTPKHHGLSPFGIEVVHEMNRLGMLVDLSHVSPDVMRQTLAASKAPVMFSHSSARALDDHPRNVPDDILKLVAANGGVVMTNFAPDYVSEELFHWTADEEAEKTRYNSPPYAGLYIGQPERAAAALAEWHRKHPQPKSTLAQVADHIEHLRAIAGIDHVGIGSDFDGIEEGPVGLGNVSCYPALLIELARRGWSDEELAKVAGENILRAMAQAEAVAAALQSEAPKLQPLAHMAE
ncbi:MAG: dipeptidase [Pseudomonadota bacterium]